MRKRHTRCFRRLHLLHASVTRLDFRGADVDGPELVLAVDTAGAESDAICSAIDPVDDNGAALSVLGSLV